MSRHGAIDVLACGLACPRTSRWAARPATGTAAVLMRLEALSDLWATGYGRWFAVKLVPFVSVVGAAAWDWRATPRLAADGDPNRIRRSIRTELGLAPLVLVATAFLVASPPPGG